MKLANWRIAGNFPDIPKYVAIIAPHTSNWDFIYGFLAYLALQIDAVWLAKASALWGPFGAGARHFGGMAVDRSRATQVVQQCIEEFAKRERMALAITPEGTRAKVAEWKRGFYFAATGAGVPIVPVALDYSTRTLRIFAPFHPSGDYAADLPQIKRLFDKSMARHPENF